MSTTTSVNTLRFGGGSLASRCALLVVSTDDKLINSMLTSLLSTNESSYDNKYQIKACSSISLYLKFPNTDNVDFIVLLINPCRYNWQAEAIYFLAEKSFEKTRFFLDPDILNILRLDLTLLQLSAFKWCLFQLQVEENIALLDKAYLISRFCLLVDTSEMAKGTADLSHIKVLKKKYSVIVLYGESRRDEIQYELSNRILRIVTGVCCNSSGLPSVIEFPDRF